MKVLGIGEIVIDRMYYCDGFIEESQKIQSEESFRSLGGPVPCALLFLRNMGCEVTLVGSVGKDSDSIYIEAEYDRYDIHTELIYDSSAIINTVLINTQNGNRAIIKGPHPNKKIQEVSVKDIREADVIVFDRTEEYAFDFVLKHKRLETKILVDTSTEWSDKTKHMIKNSDAPIFPIEVVRQMSNKDNMRYNLELLYKEVGRTIIVTDGGNGTYIFDGKERITIPASVVDVIDTDGAGDVFRAAYMWGYMNDWDMLKSVEFANKIAGLQCTKKGNLTAVPNKEDLNNLQKI